MQKNSSLEPPEILSMEEIAKKLDLALTCLDDEHTSLARTIIKELLTALRK